MMGTKAREFATHTAISVEALVPADHFYRHLERSLDLAFVRDLVHEHYAAGGRPGIDTVAHCVTEDRTLRRGLPHE